MGAPGVATHFVADVAAAADLACDLLIAAVAGGARRVGVATGSTFAPVYRELARRAPSWDDVELFLLDEYLGLTDDDPRSFRHTIARQVCEPLSIPPHRLHSPLDLACDAENAAGGYEAMLAAAPVDLQLLGIGGNGHLGFNEPGAPVDSLTRVVALAPRTRADNAPFFGDHSGDVPEQAITQGLATILRARRIVLVATGARKAEPLARALTGPVDSAMPASVLRLHADACVVADADAARLLPSPRLAEPIAP